jgi:hypothetical protein
LANSQKKTDALKLLESYQITSTDGTVHWSSIKKEKSTNSLYQQSQPVDIETSSFVLFFK